VSRGYRRPDADLYTFTVRDTIPTFPVPLKQTDTEPVVDLQQLLRDIYERARFDLVIDYSQPPKPSLWTGKMPIPQQFKRIRRARQNLCHAIGC
jgi:Protein of unknown function (DUF4058)